MKYLIPENRMFGLMSEFMKTIRPNFSRENVTMFRGITPDGVRYLRYYDDKTGERHAKYLPEYQELQLDRDLFNSLEGIFGEDMTMVIDWFNNEFGQYAESITF